ncbi:MAG: Zn-dependent exopeptidase M28 [Clostridiales bacterium]|jgi:acetylornithine deacetylase/succinyl-diaminopimelate desuccinylase-like protein|nr:Zn-dependent exopeptidase M28 [Clostridiales bacterium]
MKLSQKIKNDAVDYMVGGIGYVIDTFEKRAPGSKGEKDAQDYFNSELAKTCDSVKTEEFTLSPDAFMDWIYITASLMIAGFISYFFLPVLAIALLLIAFIPLISQLVMYKTLIDPLFKKKTSVNVVGVIKPTGTVKRRIIINGHADATQEWHWHYKFGMKGLLVVVAASLVGAFYIIGLSIAALITNGAEPAVASGVLLILGLCGLVFVVFWVALYKFHDKKVIVDGANDNLTACYVSLAVPKAFKEGGIKLKNTELCVLISGSEEAGLRGAKAFAKAHKEEYSDVETIVVCMETLREAEHFSLYTKDINGTVKTDLDVAGLVREAGKSNGVDLKYATVSLGATDSGAFAQAGFKSTCLAAMAHNLQDYYHTRRDTKDNLDPAVIGKAFDIVTDAIFLYDEKGL